jgi:hypothetical protein
VSHETSTFRHIRGNKIKKIALATAFAMAAASSASGWVVPALLLIAIAAAADKK